MSTIVQATKTGRNVTHYGITLPEVSVPGGCTYPEVFMVDGVAYYVHDFGGVWVGSRQVRGVDAGGNEIHPYRTAPASTTGVTAPQRGSYVTAQYSAPEVFFAN